MIIKDDFFSRQQIDELRASINEDIETHGGEFGNEELDGEKDHHQTESCGLFHLRHETRDLYLKFLIEKKIFHKKCLEEYDLTLRYHQLRYPYHSTWHKDRLADWDGDEVDYIGVSYFLNNDWNYTKGGMYLYKEHKESTQGYYIEPIGNRIIINDDDLYHAVTTITDQSAIRYSLQMFIHKKYLLT